MARDDNGSDAVPWFENGRDVVDVESKKKAHSIDADKPSSFVMHGKIRQVSLRETPETSNRVKRSTSAPELDVPIVHMSDITSLNRSRNFTSSTDANKEHAEKASLLQSGNTAIAGTEDVSIPKEGDKTTTMTGPQTYDESMDRMMVDAELAVYHADSSAENVRNYRARRGCFGCCFGMTGSLDDDGDYVDRTQQKLY